MFKLWGIVENFDELLVDEYEIVKKKEFDREIKKNITIEYINLPCAFDTEASSFYNGDEKRALLYCWQIGINGRVYIGRTWEEFKIAIKKIVDFYDLSYTRRLVIYVHNLPYDFQWIRKHLQWNSIFAREERKIMKGMTNDGIVFKCSYALSGSSLATVGKNLVKYKVDKMSGDLNYDLLRTPITPLSQKEQQYCVHDCLVVMAYIQEEIEFYGDVAQIPLTNTGKVRRYCADYCLTGDRGKSYFKYIHGLNINGLEEYEMLKNAFQGGFTHASYEKVGDEWEGIGKVFENVSSKDFTSSYPTVMIAEQFPCTTGKRRTDLTIDEIRNGGRLSIFNIKFINIRRKENVHETYLSFSKCFNVKKPKLDNGRVFSANELITTITNIDLEIIDQCYDYDDNPEIGLGYTYGKSYLPKSLIECILHFYEKKTTLKDVEGEEVEYQLFKGNLNSTYGMSVTDIVNDDILYIEDRWINDTADDTEEEIERKKIDNITDYNKNRHRFLFYPWGVFITAYARKNLWTGIIECGEDYIYADTDSVKILNAEKHEKYFADYNTEIIEKLQKCLSTYGIDVNKIKPRTIKGKEKPLGVWDDDGDYEKFKTLGAKRYLVKYKKPYECEIDGKKETLIYKCTIAGVNKFKTSRYLENQNDPFETFSNKMCIDEENSGRLIVKYIDYKIEGRVADYKGVCYNYVEESGVHIEKSDYNLSLAEDYLRLILGSFSSEDARN